MKHNKCTCGGLIWFGVPYIVFQLSFRHLYSRRQLFLQHSQVTYVEYAALPSLAESDAELNALCLAKRRSAKAIHCEDGVECLAAP